MSEGMAVVIPVRGRLQLVRRLLASVRADDSAVDVVLVDDTPGAGAEPMRALALEHQARVIRAGPHVGAKRNAGAATCEAATLLFLDSDVVMLPGTLAAHARTLANGAAASVGGVRFVGPRSTAFRVLEHMQVMLPFSYADAETDVPWGPTANLGVRRDAFLEIGGFDESFPGFGGEDVDLGLRLRARGGVIRTTPDAGVEHTTETWSTMGQNAHRLLSYGRADFHLMRAHPGRVFWDFPTGPQLWLMQTVATLGAVGLGQVSAWALLSLPIAVLATHLGYAAARGPSVPLWLRLAGPMVFHVLDLGKNLESMRGGRLAFCFQRFRWLDEIITADWVEVRAAAVGIYVGALAWAAAMLLVPT